MFGKEVNFKLIILVIKHNAWKNSKPPVIDEKKETSNDKCP